MSMSEAKEDSSKDEKEVDPLWLDVREGRDEDGILDDGEFKS